VLCTGTSKTFVFEVNLLYNKKLRSRKFFKKTKIKISEQKLKRRFFLMNKKKPYSLKEVFNYIAADNENIEFKNVCDGIEYEDKIISFPEINTIIETEQKKTNDFRKIVCIFMVVSMAFIVYIAFNLCNCNCNCGNMAMEDPAIVFDPNAHEPVETTPTPPELLYESISVPGYGDKIYLPEGSDILNLTMHNPANNTVYFQYTIILTDSNEVIYQSEQIKPGLEITEQYLNTTFKAGEYPITIKIDTIDIETQSKTNGETIQSKLIVE
jgi:hypothetical protein